VYNGKFSLVSLSEIGFLSNQKGYDMEPGDLNLNSPLLAGWDESELGTFLTIGETK
jgi:hypothetical protein